MPIICVAMDKENSIGFGHAKEEPFRSGLDGETLLETIPDLVFCVDREGKLLDLRARAESELYVSREAIVGQTLHDTLPATVADGALRRIALALDTGDAQVYDYQLPMPQGLLDFEARVVVSGADEVICLVRDTTERKQAERELRRQNAYQAALHETALDMMHRLEPADLLKSIVERAGALMATPHGYVYLLEPGEAKLEMRVGVGIYEEYVGYRLKLGEGLAGKVWRSGQSLVVEDYAAWEGHSTKFTRDDRFRAVVGVPLKSGSEVLGVIGLSYREEDRTFRDEELELLTRFADLASIALDNARLYTSAQRELTERVRAEALLLQQSTAMESSIDGMAILDENGRFVYLNEAHARLYGYDAPEELLGKGWDVLYDEDQLPLLHRYAIPALREHGHWRGEAVGRRRDGNSFPQELSISALKGGGFACVVRDVTERKEAEEAHRRSEERFRSLVQNSSDIITVISADGTILYQSPSMKRTLAHEPRDRIGKNIFESPLIHPDDAAKQKDLIDQTIREPGLKPVFEARLRHVDGSWRWVEGIVSNLLDNPSVGGIVLNFRDITERKRAEERLKESEGHHRRQARELSLLHQVRTALAGELDPTAVFRMVVEAVAEAYGYAQVSAYLIEDDAEGPTLVLQHQVGYRTVLKRVPVSEGVMGRVARTGRPVLLEDVREDPDFLGAIEGITSEVCAPLFDGERLVGTLNVESTGGRRLTEDDLRVMSALAEHAGMAVGSARLHACIKEAEERFRAFFEHSAAGISIATPDRILMETNPAYQRMTGYTAEELYGMPIAELSHPDDVSEDGELNERLRSGVLERYRREKRYVRKSGETIWIRPTVSTVRDDAGEPRFLVGMVEDVTERKALEESLAHRASHDALTGLPNRSLLTERLAQALSRAERKGWRVVLLFMDLDNFKVVNDSMGHEAGDRLLVAVAERLRRAVRPEDTVARLGGDEFVVLLEETDLEEATRVSDRIAESLRAPFVLGGGALPRADTDEGETGISREVFVSASVGIAVSDADRKEPGQLMRDADLAMYRAKAQGKARHAVFEEKMGEAPPKRLDVENRFRKAVQRGEIVAHYQPKVSLGQGGILGMEALARWVDPERGLVLPSEFIPMAEETGLIVPMGESMLRQACRQAQAWREEHTAVPSVVVWVNLSPKQFHRADVVGQVSCVLEETGLDPRGLGLEITEGVVMDDAESTIETLRRLKAMGVRLAIDDFGKGYSSLGYVKRFPVDVLKVDRSFIGGICDYPEDLAIVQAVITLTQSLGMEVVAEGVENAEQLEMLRDLGCDQAQGYHLARPMPEHEATVFLMMHGDPR